MRTWSEPYLHTLERGGQLPKLFNSATGRLESPPLQDNKATLYVCGITPYDATHLGHAFTYLTFDLLQRAWLDAGVEVIYAQNITDIDDPLLERAKATGVKWKELAAEQVALFRSDMHRLAMLPPQHYVAVTDKIAATAAAIAELLEKDFAYLVPVTDGSAVTQETVHNQSANAAPAYDIYFDYQKAQTTGVWQLGDVLSLSAAEYLKLSASRGGDPERQGKRNQLDPLLWRAARQGEPSWDTVLGAGRPGWHIECSIIAHDALSTPFTVQGGGEDLRFPHHEFSAANAAALYGTPLAHLYAHTAMVSYQGHKISKSRGNLVFIHKLLDAGYSGSEIRLALLEHHYRSAWEWHDADIIKAKQKLARWQQQFLQVGADPQPASEVVAQLRAALANDLDTPLMLSLINQAAYTGVDEPEFLVKAIENLLGITIYETAETGVVTL